MSKEAWNAPPKRDGTAWGYDKKVRNPTNTLGMVVALLFIMLFCGILWGCAPREEKGVVQLIYWTSPEVKAPPVACLLAVYPHGTGLACDFAEEHPISDQEFVE